jgi:hypothetical protein
MTKENKLTEEQLFDQLISSLVHSAWVSLGKVKNPMNDALERNLDQASVQIDMLDMLHKRMSGNLSKNEEEYLGHLVRELKMNFVEEKNKPAEDNKEDAENENLEQKENEDSTVADEKEENENSSKDKKNGETE